MEGVYAMTSLKKKKTPVNTFILVVAFTVLIYYTLVGVWPFLFNIFLSFRRTDLITVNKFVGLKNYKFMMNDPMFWKSLWHNFYYLGVMVSLGIITSLVFAALIYRTSGVMKKVYTAMFFAPVTHDRLIIAHWPSTRPDSWESVIRFSSRLSTSANVRFLRGRPRAMFTPIERMIVSRCKKF